VPTHDRRGPNDLPIFLVAIPAGALADIFDVRRFLIVGEVAYTLMSTIFAAIVWLGAATPINLIVFTFLTGVAAALVAPAWQSVVPRPVFHMPTCPAV